MSHVFARAITVLACLTTSLVLSRSARAQQGPFVYTTFDSAVFSDLGVIDASAANPVFGSISMPVDAGGNGATPDYPIGVAVSGDGSAVYVVEGLGSYPVLSIVNTAGVVVDTTGISVNSGAAALNAAHVTEVLDPNLEASGLVAATPNGATVYVGGYASNDSGPDAQDVVAINAKTGAVAATIPLSEVSGMALTPDGSTLYVTGDDTVTPIRVATNAAETPIQLGADAPLFGGIAIAPDGKTIYVTTYNEQTGAAAIVPIDTGTGAAGPPIPLGSDRPNSNEPLGLAISPDGRTLYVALEGADVVAVVDTSANTLTKTISLGNINPAGLAISPDGETLYVGTNNFTSGANAGVLPIDLADDALGSIISGFHTYSLAMCSNGNALLASGLTFVANTSGALQCTLASGPTGSPGPVFTGGTMQFAGASISSALPIVLESQGGTFDTDGNNATLSGPITGPGGLSKIGAGTLTLSGQGTYSGPTAVDVGTLQAGAANAFSPNSDYSVAAGATLDLNNFKQTIGSLAGAGDVTLGSALLTLGADNADPVFSGDISGSGGLTKIGTGEENLSGANDYTGPTDVQGGTLLVTGSLASPVTVESGAMLGGSGTIGGLNALAGALIAPGAATPYSTLTVSGDARFAVGSTYAVNVNAAGQSDALAIKGSATLAGGTVVVTAAPGVYTPLSHFTLLTAAGGVSGTFAQLSVSSTLSQAFAFLTPELSYGADDVALGFAQTTSFASVALTRNQAAVAAALQALGLGNPLYDAVVGLNGGGAREAFDAISGEAYASATAAAYQDSRLPREAILDRLSAPFDASSADVTSDMNAAYPPNAAGADAYATRQPQIFTVWGRGFGDWGVNRGDGNAARLARATSGFMVGEDAQVLGLGGGDWRFGAAEGFTSDDFSVPQRASSGNLQSVFGALYAGARFGAIDLRAGAITGVNAIMTEREIVFPGLAQATQADASGDTEQIFAEAGYRVDYSGASLQRMGLREATLEPLFGAADVNVRQDAFTDDGGAAALTSLTQTYNVPTTTLGLRAETQLAGPLPLALRGFLGWRRAEGALTPAALLAFQSAAGQTFSVSGAPIDRNALETEAGLSFAPAPGVTLGVSYSGQYGAHATDNAVRGEFALTF